MGTIKTKTHEIPCISAINMPQEVLALTLANVSFADAATIFSDARETETITVRMGEVSRTYSGFTKLEMIRQSFNGLDVGLKK